MRPSLSFNPKIGRAKSVQGSMKELIERALLEAQRSTRAWSRLNGGEKMI
jgi:hypothetical protein